MHFTEDYLINEVGCKYGNYFLNLRDLIFIFQEKKPNTFYVGCDTLNTLGFQTPHFNYENISKINKIHKPENVVYLALSNKLGKPNFCMSSKLPLVICSYNNNKTFEHEKPNCQTEFSFKFKINQMKNLIINKKFLNINDSFDFSYITVYSNLSIDLNSNVIETDIAMIYQISPN